MLIKQPCCITPRLLPGIQVGRAFVSIEYARPSDGRQAYRWYIDLPDDGGDLTGEDLKSGVGGGSLQSGLESLLSFLSACGESWRYDQRRGGDGTGGENSDLFPPEVATWAAENSDELSMLSSELEEAKGAVIIE